MEYRKMGRTGLKLSLLSYGSWVTFSRQVDDSASDRLMGLAYDSGINFFDNAEAYEGGRSEEMMGRVLKSKNWDRTSYCISSKAFFGLYGKNNKPTQHGLSRKHLTEACHAALRRMQTDYLDLFYCHRPDPETPMDEIVWTMNILMQQGKILYWGTSEWGANEILEAHESAKHLGLIGPAVEQPQYNLFERTNMELDYLPVFKNYGMGTTIWSPLASGLLTGKYNDGIPAGSRLALENYSWLKERVMQEEKLEKVRELDKLAHDLGTSLATLSIAWCLCNPNVTSAILGATKEEQLTENLRALEIYPKLTEAILAEIDLIMGTRP
ncbi:aldo/keto reductase [Nemorincola caseinilytica]|uniref:Aldo/keto reductase n=1 Tax=Nemorincola caseinilytica TaxID=2054315 RepID=A0ABP8NCM2_9BACT